MSKSYNLDKAVVLVEQAVEQAEEYQAQLEHNKESMKLMDVVAKFLRKRKRLLYGGYAINALLPEKKKFYNPEKELPDFDFLSPDPLTDVAELIQDFINLGYKDVEPAIGIHEGTYKVFVNFQGVADITYCDPLIYATLQSEAYKVDSLHICSPNYLRMNMYAELSKPAGDISRWTKVYRRLLLLNEAHPFQDGCKNSKDSNTSNKIKSTLTNIQKIKLYSKFITQLKESGDVLLGIPDSQAIFAKPSQPAKGRFRTLKRALKSAPFLTLSLSNSPKESAKQLQTVWNNVLGTELTLREVGGVGELVPERVEIVYNNTEILGIVFQTISCHAYYTVNVGNKEIRIGSIDTLLNFFFSFYFGKLDFLRGQQAVLCVCQKLMELAESVRVLGTRTWPFPAFAVSCLGYQPTLAELKKEHRERVKKERQKKKAEIKFRKTIKAKLSAKKNTRKVSKQAENT